MYSYFLLSQDSLSCNYNIQEAKLIIDKLSFQNEKKKINIFVTGIYGVNYKSDFYLYLVIKGSLYLVGEVLQSVGWSPNKS